MNIVYRLCTDDKLLLCRGVYRGKWMQLLYNLAKGQKESPTNICTLTYKELYQFQL